MIAKGALRRPLLYQFALGVKYGAPASAQTIELMRSMIPADAQWGAFGVGPMSDRMVAQSFLLGGHCRVGMEDNLYIERGVFAPSNAALVERAVDILRLLGGEPATPREARAILKMRDDPRAGAPAASGTEQLSCEANG
jgi:uncharacterized protein (DUF849 family)